MRRIEASPVLVQTAKRAHQRKPASEISTHVWRACYTQSRCEKKVSDLLGRRGIESFLPLAMSRREWHDRTKLVSLPMFPGYVFARFSADHVLTVLQTPGVATIVHFDGRMAEIPECDIENIGRFARILAERQQEPPALVDFERGQSVCVSSGPFEGVQGTVLELRGRRRFLVGIQRIGIAFEIDVPAGSLRHAVPELLSA